MIIEYALIIALISIALVIALQPQSIGTGVASLITRVTNCLTAAVCT